MRAQYAMVGEHVHGRDQMRKKDLYMVLRLILLRQERPYCLLLHHLQRYRPRDLLITCKITEKFGFQ